MGYVFNPLLAAGFDQTGNDNAATPGGSDTQVQFNDDGVLGASADLTWDDTGKVLEVGGDINLDDGGTYETTLQVVTPTAARTISFPDATGTVGLVAGSSGQLLYNASGANAGTSTITYDGTNVTLTGRFISSLNGAASAPPGTFTGTWFTGGTATTTKPQVLIEPTGATSTAWSTSGTGFGVNAASGFAGNLLDLQVNGTSQANVTSAGGLTLAGGLNVGVSSVLQFGTSRGRINSTGANGLTFANNGAGQQIGFDFAQSNEPGLTVTGNNIAIRSGTNAQTFRVYGTFTDASNYVRAALSSTSTAVTLAAETAGTGADDIPLNLTAAGTGTIKVNSNLEIADAKDIVLATGTGTKIGTATTQKLGFWNKSPVVQPTTAISAATFVVDSGGSIHPTSTFDGYTIAQVVAALRSVGILA